MANKCHLWFEKFAYVKLNSKREGGKIGTDKSGSNKLSTGSESFIRRYNRNFKSPRINSNFTKLGQLLF